MGQHLCPAQLSGEVSAVMDLGEKVLCKWGAQGGGMERRKGY